MQNMLAIETIWKMGLRAGLMIPVVALCSFLLRRQSKKYSYGLWLLVILRLLVPVFVESPVTADGFITEKMQVIGQNIFAGQKASLPENRAVSLQAEGNKNVNEVQNADKGDKSKEQFEEGGVTAVKQLENEGDILRQYDLWQMEEIFACIWLAGLILAGLYFFTQFVRVKRQTAVAIHRDRNVWLCDRIPTPFVMGIVHPRIYIPFHLSEEDEHCILEHERMHIRHGDHIMRLLGMLAACLHWWNPLVWVAVNRLNQDMEMYCDEAAVAAKSVAEKKQYMTALLHFAVKGRQYMGVVAFGESHTEKRVMHLLVSRQSNRKMTVLITVIAVILCLGAFTVQGKADGISDTGQEDWQQSADARSADTSNTAWKGPYLEKEFPDEEVKGSNTAYDSMEAIWGVTQEQAAEWLGEFTNALRTNDRQWVAEHVGYPCILSVDNKEIRLDDAGDLLLHYDNIFTAEFVEQIHHWAEDGLWANWQGLALGNGNIWFYLQNEEWMIYTLMYEEKGLEICPVTSSKQ